MYFTEEIVPILEGMKVMLMQPLGTDKPFYVVWFVLVWYPEWGFQLWLFDIEHPWYSSSLFTILRDGAFRDR